MNSDQVKGTVNDAAGRVKRQVGEWTNDSNAQVEGAAQQLKGKAQKAVGNVKEAVHDTHDNIKQEHREDVRAREAAVPPARPLSNQDQQPHRH